MRIRNPFDDIFGRRSKVALIRYLIRSRRETTGRDLARSVGLDHKACLESLADLDRENIVQRRGVGRAWFFRLNLEFPLVREVLIPMFDWERDLPERLARDIRKVLGRNALSIFLFGSTAKGTDERESDVDLLIVGKDKAAIESLKEKAHESFDRLIKNYSRVPQHVYMDAREFTTKYRKKDPFLTEILRSGRLLDGLRVEEILKHGAPPNRRSKGVPR
jgi:predicted nucleotidyltransferase